MDDQSLPRPFHVAIIMDGNGRWAEARGKPRLHGHREGVRRVKEVVEEARRMGISHLTLYAFSTENWRRPPAEVEGLMSLLRSYLEAELTTMLENDIRLSCFGEMERLPDFVRGILERAIQRTSPCQGMRLNLALSYGSRAEILRAARQLARRCAAGELRPEDIGEEDMAAALYSAGQPDPDLLIRTSGEQRLSNFLLWQLSYAELYFSPLPWPEFGPAQLNEAVESFLTRQRRFGRTGEQLRFAEGT